MERTLHYYNCFITLNGDKTSIPFSRLLENVFLLDEDSKYREIKNNAYSLIKMKYPDQNYRDVNDRVICFANYRNKKPFLGNRRSDRLDAIPDDVIESTTCFFQHTNRMMIFEYNHHGARPKHIERYLSLFLPKTDEHFWDVEFVEINPAIGVEDVRNSHEIRNIEFRLDLSTNQRRQIIAQDAPESILTNLFIQAVDAQAHIGGNIAKITFGNGRKKTNQLDPQEIIGLINALDLESDLYESVRVKYYSNELRKIHELDLKHAGVLKKTIDVEGDSWQVIGDTIEINFYNRGRTGQNNHQRFAHELIEETLPELVIPLAPELPEAQNI